MATLLLWESVCLSEEEKFIKLYLNSPLENESPSQETKSPIGKSLLDLINNAKNTIDFAVFGIRGQKVIQNALFQAKKRGVRIRGVVDKDIKNRNYYWDTVPFIKKLGNVRTDYRHDKFMQRKFSNAKRKAMSGCEAPQGFNGPPQCYMYFLPDGKPFQGVWASKQSLEFKGNLMHNKFFIVDNEYVWTGSANFSDTCFEYNANNALLMHSSQAASWYEQEFEEMYLKGNFSRDKRVNQRGSNLFEKIDPDTTVSVYFSPQGYPMWDGIELAIKQAQKKIDIAVFYLTHKYIVQDLMDAKKRGVRVRVIVDATGASNEYSKHEAIRASGIPVKVENWGAKLHMKSAIIDDAIVILGSMNWTAAGEKNNDENTLIIHNQELAKEYSLFYEKLWESIPEQWLEGRPEPESLDSMGSCSDGIDNDFDKLKDMKDPQCKVEVANNLNK